MAEYFAPVVSAQYIFYTGLIDQTSTLKLKSTPTLASGDFKVSIDGGALANLGTLPTVTPASSVMVKVTLATTEMAGANATFVAIDAAGAEWCDQLQNFQTVARNLANLAYPATSGRSMVVDAAGLVDANMVKAGPTASGTAQTTGDIFARLGAPAGASMSADIAAVKTDTAAVKVQTDKLAFTVANQIDANVIDWKGATAPAMTGDAFARLGAPAGASTAADIAAVKVDTAAVKVQTDKLTFTVANQVDVNVKDWAGTAVTAPNTAGTPVVDVGRINNVATTPVTTVKAVQGLTTADTISALAANTITAASINADAITAAKVAADVGVEIGGAVWDIAIASHLGAGTTGLALNSAGAAGDPWSTAIPGAYPAGSAGHIVGTAIPDVAAGLAGGLVKVGTNAGIKFESAGIAFDIHSTGQQALHVVSDASDGAFIGGGGGGAGLWCLGDTAGGGQGIVAEGDIGLDASIGDIQGRVNVGQVNAIELQGAGTTVNPWRPA